MSITQTVLVWMMGAAALGHPLRELIKGRHNRRYLEIALRDTDPANRADVLRASRSSETEP